MTAPDGGPFGGMEGGVVLLPGTQAILLHGGRALLLFEGADKPPPRRGRLFAGGGHSAWAAECWQMSSGPATGWCGLAVLDVLPLAGAELRSDAEGETRRWRIGANLSVDIAPHALADLVRKAGGCGRTVFDFLVRHLIEGRPADCAEAQAHQAFARGFFTAAAERDGFIEILAEPECGGVLAQGWSLSLPPGAVKLASVSGDLAVHDVEVAHFERDDILPPGRGFCLYGKAWKVERMADIDAVFFERDGRLLRLDVVSSTVVRFAEAAASGHVAHMLPRLAGPEATLRGFKRICRPRFHGEDTLKSTTLPIAVGIDALLQAPDGGLLAMGWLLDPARQVEQALIKSTGNLYAQLHLSWVRLPRPDLCAGFAADPRFAGLLDPEDALFGFIAHVPAPRGRVRGAQVYLEFVLLDETCLFSPLTVTAFESGERLPQVLAGLSPNEPELARIVEDHLTPFLASVAPKAPALTRRGLARPVPLGAARAEAPVAAVMPVAGLAELQAVFGLLAGTPDAAALDLTLVCPRGIAADLVRPLDAAFRFYGLGGSLVIASERDTLAARLDAGVQATHAPQVLAWTPQALPKAPGWLAALMVEAGDLDAPGLLSPAMTYEDGSVYHGGQGRLAATEPSEAISAFAGYGGQWLPKGALSAAATGAAEIALVSRATLARAGGFSGPLFGDGLAHVDLAARLRAAGAGIWCSGTVEFWMLEEPRPGAPTPIAGLMRQIDAALLRRRTNSLGGDATP